MGFTDSGVSQRVISQLLTEMDGVLVLEDVVVIAATNRPDILDPAILRPGRFDRLIYVPKPDDNARLEIFKIYTKDMPLEENVNLSSLANLTRNYSGADIEALCREAAMNALRRDIDVNSIILKDFREAMKKIGPSVSQSMDTWYQNFMKQVRSIEKPATPVA
jgi:transitional endoplasmic reticulum ATPase